MGEAYNLVQARPDHREESGMRWKVALTVIGIGVLTMAGTTLAAQADGAGDAKRGGELYVQYCAACHGIDGQGRIGASLEAFPGIQVNAALVSTIAAGVEGSVMPAWSTTNGGPLADQDISDLAAYIQGAFGGTEPVHPAPTYQPPVIPPLPDVEGDPTAGAVVYHDNCVACHGDRGQGVFGYTLAKDWPANDPAAYIRSVAIGGIDGSKMPAWGQAQGGPLSDQQVADVAAFILTLKPVEAASTPPAEPLGPLGRTASLLILIAIAAVVGVALIIYYRRA